MQRARDGWRTTPEPASFMKPVEALHSCRFELPALPGLASAVARECVLQMGAIGAQKNLIHREQLAPRIRQCRANAQQRRADRDLQLPGGNGVRSHSGGDLL